VGVGLIVGNAGDLVGNWSWTVWLLIPLALALAVATSLAVGSGAESSATDRREGGVTRSLARRSTASASTKETS